MAKDTDMLWKISDKLISAREKAGMTQEELAEAIGVQPNSIHRYEAGAREMGLTIAITRLNRKRMQGAVKILWQMVNREL